MTADFLKQLLLGSGILLVPATSSIVSSNDPRMTSE